MYGNTNISTRPPVYRVGNAPSEKGVSVNWDLRGIVLPFRSLEQNKSSRHFPAFGHDFLAGCMAEFEHAYEAGKLQL